MTIRKGEKFLVESFAQFQQRLDVSDEEVIQAMPEHTREEMVDEENILRAEDGDSPTDDPTAVHDDVFHQAVRDRGFNQVVIDVLEARNREYVHLFDGTVHTVVELFPTEDGVLP